MATTQFPTGDPYIDGLIQTTGSYGSALAEASRMAEGDPNASINRVGFITYFADALGLDTSDPSLAQSTFTDVGGLTPHQLGAISALMKIGVIQGTSSSTFSPADPMLRGHASLMMERAGIDPTGVITDTTRPGDAITGNEIGYIQQRLPNQQIGTNGATVSQVQGGNLAAQIDPLQDPAFAVFMANAGVQESDLDASLKLAYSQYQAKLDLAASQLNSLLGMAQQAQETAGGMAQTSYQAAVQEASLRLAAARENMEATIARAQGNMQSTIDRNAPIYDWERNMAEQKVFQDYETRGFFRSGARLDARDDAFQGINLQQAASEEAARQAFLNTQTSANTGYNTAQASYGAANVGASASYQNALAAAELAYDSSTLSYQNAYDSNALNYLLGYETAQDEYNQSWSAIQQQKAYEELLARERLTNAAFAGAGGYG